MSKISREELLSAYLDGELSAAEQAEAEKLLADDESAKAMLDELREVSRAVKELPGLKLDENIGPRVLGLAERRMLADSPGEGLCVTPLKSGKDTFWRGLGRRFLTLRAVVWSTAAVAVAVILAFHEAEEKAPLQHGPIAMDMKADEAAPGDHFVAKTAAVKEECKTEIRPKRGPDEFRAAPMPAAKETVLPAGQKKSLASVPPTVKQPTSKMADDLGRLAAGAAPLPEVVVNCYFVSSRPDARKELEKIIFAQRQPSDKAEAESHLSEGQKQGESEEKNLRKKADDSKPERIAFETTPAELEQLMAEIRKRSKVFGDCSIDVDSPKPLFDKTNAAAADIAENYRAVFILRPLKTQPPAGK